VEDPSGRLMGYIFGKSEGEGKLWHGHVTAGKTEQQP
jgi:N-terminal acetyltransferase B complex catalytic subunit